MVIQIPIKRKQMKFKIILVCCLLVWVKCKQETNHRFELIEETMTENFNFYAQLWEEKGEKDLYFQVKIFKVLDKDVESLMLRDSLEKEYFEGRISNDPASMEIINNLRLNFDDYPVLKDTLYKISIDSVDFKPHNLKWSSNKRILIVRHLNEEISF